MSQVAALPSWMKTFGSSDSPSRSLAESPLTTASSPTPQWYGSPTWCTTWSAPNRTGAIRSVTSTRASTAVRAVVIVAQPRCSSPRSRASSGDTSQKNSGCSSDRYGSQRLMPPAVWCSVSR